MAAEPTKQKTRRNDSNQEAGMINMKLIPKSFHFNNWVRANRNDKIVQFNNISNAIYNLYRTVDVKNDPESKAKIDSWLDAVFSERDKAIKMLETQVSKFMSSADKDDPFISAYSSMAFDQVIFRFNHPRTGQFLRFFIRVNDMTEKLHIMWLTGKISEDQYQTAFGNVTADLQVGIDCITKAFNVARRENGKYEPEEYLKKIKNYKSIDAYVASLVEEAA